MNRLEPRRECESGGGYGWVILRAIILGLVVSRFFWSDFETPRQIVGWVATSLFVGLLLFGRRGLFVLRPVEPGEKPGKQWPIPRNIEEVAWLLAIVLIFIALLVPS